MLLIISIVVLSLIILWVIIVLSSSYTTKKLIEDNLDKPCSINLTGAQFCHFFLKVNGVTGVKVEYTEKENTNFYDSKNKIIVLNETLCFSNSISSIAVAGHEAGHAIQHNKKELVWSCNFALKLLTAFFSLLFVPTSIAGLVMLYYNEELAKILLLVAGAMFIAMFLLKFSSITLEKSASKKVYLFLKKLDVLSGSELKKIKQILKSASYTYISDLFMSLFNISRLMHF